MSTSSTEESPVGIRQRGISCLEEDYLDNEFVSPPNIRKTSDSCVLLRAGSSDSAFIYLDETRNRVFKRANYSLKHEFSILDGVNHPNIIRYFGFSERAMWSEIEMEYCERGHLAKNLKQFPDYKSAIGCLLQVSQAVAHIHSLEIVHLDIKPENVLISLRHTLILSDFGLSQRVSPSFHLHEFVGTSNYAAPELRYELLTDGKKADMFSLGVLAVEVLYWRHPFEKVDLREDMYGMAVFQPDKFWEVMESRSGRHPGLSPTLRRTLQLLLSPFPALRPSAEEFSAVIKSEALDLGICPAI